jgi:hypothetical protein
MAFYAVSNTNGKMVERPFAYTYSAVFTNDGWRLSDIMQDYRRQGLLDCREWRVSAFTILSLNMIDIMFCCH